jgi:hypothetical protein
MNKIVTLVMILIAVSGCDENRIVSSCVEILGEEFLTDFRRDWVTASPPILADGTQILDYPATHYWSNVILSDEFSVYCMRLSQRDLNPEIHTKCNNSLSSMFLNSIDPGISGWYGIMRGIPGGLDISSAGYLEIWVNDYTVDPLSRAGVIYIDIGRIDEDYHRPDENEFDDESYLDWTVEDDIGFIGDYPACVYPRDFHDCYDPVLLTCMCINSRIGNHRHDTEDLDNNGQFDQTNHFFRVAISLSDSAAIDIQRDYPYEDYSAYWDECLWGDNYGEPFNCPFNRSKAWRLYRIDLSNLDQNVIPSGYCAPLKEYVTHIRIWIPDADEINNQFGHLIHIYGLKFTD